MENTGLETLLRGFRVGERAKRWWWSGRRNAHAVVAGRGISEGLSSGLHCSQPQHSQGTLLSAAPPMLYTNFHSRLIHTHTQHTHPHAAMARQTQSMQQPIIWGGNSLHELMMKLSLNSAELERLELCSALLTDCGAQSRADDVKANLFLSAVQIWLCEFTCK